MIIFGLASLLQMFLPGWIITGFFKWESWLQRFILSFALSLLFNQWLVIILVSLHAYHRILILSLIITEIAGLSILWLVNYKRIVSAKFHWSWSLPRDWLSVKSLVIIVIWLVSLVTFGVIIHKIVSVNPGVFDSWDDLVSFNKWALIWYDGRIPLTERYPQLIPTNWSLIYKIINTGNIHFFAKAVMGLFPIFIVLMLFDLYHRLRHTGFLIGVISTSVLLIIFSWAFIGTGYVDLPVTFMSFAAIYLLLPSLCIKLNKSDIIKNLLWSAVLAGCAMLTKQAGLYIIVPVIVGGYLSMRKLQLSFKQILQPILIAISITVLLVGPWYGFKIWQIAHGQDSSEASSISGALTMQHKTTNRLSVLNQASSNLRITLGVKTIQILYPKSVSQGIKEINSSSWSIHWLVLVNLCALIWLLLIICSWRVSIIRYLMIYAIIPYYFIWVFSTSYDYRNLNLILPFVGIAVGFGLVNIINGIAQYFSRHVLLPNTFTWHQSDGIVSPNIHHQDFNFSIPLGSIIWWSMVILTGIILQMNFPDSKLYAMQEQKMYNAGGMPDLNKSIYQYYYQYGLEGKIYTNDQPLGYLPKIKDYVIPSNTILDLKLLTNAEKNPEIHYIIWSISTIDPSAKTYIENKINSGNYKFISNHYNYIFFKIKS